MNLNLNLHLKQSLHCCDNNTSTKLSFLFSLVRLLGKNRELDDSSEKFPAFQLLN